MTDENAPTTKAHRHALRHLERVAARRAAALAHTATWTPNAPQSGAQGPTDPPPEGSP